MPFNKLKQNWKGKFSYKRKSPLKGENWLLTCCNFHFSLCKSNVVPLRCKIRGFLVIMNSSKNKFPIIYPIHSIIKLDVSLYLEIKTGPKNVISMIYTTNVASKLLPANIYLWEEKIICVILPPTCYSVSHHMLY